MTSILTPARTVPAWFETLRLRFGRGEAHMFLLHGQTSDFVYPGWPVARWLGRQFAGTLDRPGRDVVLSVSLDGIAFQTVAMRRLFEKTLGMQLSSDPEERAAQTAPGAPDDVPLPTSPDQMLAMVIEFLKQARRSDPEDPDSGPAVRDGARSAAAIVKRLDLMLPPGDKAALSPERLHMIQMLDEASTDKALEDAWNPLVLLAPTIGSVHADVVEAAGLRSIKVPLPDTAARLAFITELVTLKPDLQLDMTPIELAALTAGLSRRDIEDITLRAADQPLTRAIALDRQQELMDERYGSVLQRLEPTAGYSNLGGNAALKEYTDERVIRPMRSGDELKLKHVPMGMALVGPPGTGKSAFAMATAFEAGINCIELKTLKEKWVGSSERNLDLLIEGAEEFAPTIVFIDEFDKAFGSSEGGGGDHPVDASMRKRLQEWLSDTTHRGRIFLMCATNYPERVDPALFRTGRIDVKAPMLPPSSNEEREDILGRLIIRYSGVPYGGSLAGFAQATDGWTGADLEFAVTKAFGTVEIRGVPLQDALLDAIATIRRADSAETRRQSEQALRACNDLSLLPQRERERLAGLASVPEPIAEAETPTIRRPRRGDI